MNILLTGGTGLIGRALCRALLDAGHSLTVFSRRPATVEARCGAAVRAIGSLDEWLPGDHYDAVINLAGEPIAGARWSARRKETLRDSRVTLTATLGKKIAEAETKPAVLLSGSAVGIYGDGGERELDESAPTTTETTDFGARLCAEWEREAHAASAGGVRTCVLRTGLVLSSEGGMLRQLLTPFKLGLGARIGDGRQWMSWIHIDDQVAIIVKLLSETHLHGAFNLCAPNPVRNADFTRALAAAVKRPAFLFAPAFVLNAALGESAGLLLGGQKAAPGKLLSCGYRFRYPDLDAALARLV